MKTKTIYVSEDEVEFENEKDCETYEEALSKMADIEKRRLGERPESAEMTSAELRMYPVLESYGHNAEDVLEMCAEISELLQSLDPNLKCFTDDAVKYITRVDSAKPADAADWWEKAMFKFKISLFMWLKCLNVRTEKCGMHTILRRLARTSPISGIEYPEPKWISCEQDFERYANEIKRYRANGCKYAED